MKQIITTILAIAVLASPSFAAPKKRTTVKTTTTTESATGTTTHEATHTYAATTNYRPMFSGDVGLGSVGRFLFGVGFRGDIPVNLDGNDFTFGGQTGFYYLPSSDNVKGWLIPILATANYHFRTNNSLKPYVGLAMGISLFHYSGDTASVTFGGTTFGGTGVSGTNVDFALLVKPGFDFGAASQYYVEVPFGTMASNFTIIPSVGMHF